MLTLLLVHAAATWFMVGLIWFVQIVHYPLFGQVGIEGFCQYSADHQRRTTSVVVGPMLIEAGASIALLAVVPDTTMQRWAIVGAALLAVVWLSTARLQVPCHERLSGGFDEASCRSLVRYNWIRTVAWTSRGIIAGMLIAMIAT